MIVEFTPGNELEEVFVRAAGDPAARVEFYRRLLSSEIYVLTEDTPVAGGEGNRETSATSTLVTWEGPTGPYVPLFSSRARVDEIAKSRERTFGYVAMRGQAAFALLAEKPRAAFLTGASRAASSFPRGHRTSGRRSAARPHRRAAGSARRGQRQQGRARVGGRLRQVPGQQARWKLVVGPSTPPQRF